MASVRLACNSKDFESFLSITKQYYTWLGEDLCFQNIDEELRALPGCYSHPTGCILLASYPSNDGSVVDCGAVALRPLEHKAQNGASECPEDTMHHEEPLQPSCEMKRLFVLPDYQGKGIGRLLVTRVLDAARCMGYACMVLDTLERLTAANALYSSAGFTRTSPYYDNPLPGVVYWRKQLQD